MFPLLNRIALQTEVEEGRLVVDPFEPSHLRPASYVLRLGYRFRRWIAGDRPIHMWSENAADSFLTEPLECAQFVLQPREFVLACTFESVGLPGNRWAVISPLSHVARFGLGIHCGADLVNPGFGATTPTQLTLELYNHNASPLILTGGMPVAHLRIAAIDAIATSASIYERQDPVGPPRFFEEMSPAFGQGVGT